MGFSDKMVSSIFRSYKICQKNDLAEMVEEKIKKKKEENGRKSERSCRGLPLGK